MEIQSPTTHTNQIKSKDILMGVEKGWINTINLFRFLKSITDMQTKMQ